MMILVKQWGFRKFSREELYGWVVPSCFLWPFKHPPLSSPLCARAKFQTFFILSKTGNVSKTPIYSALGTYLNLFWEIQAKFQMMWEKKKTNWSRISAAWHSRGRADWVCLIAGSDVWCRQIWTLASGSATSLQCHSYSCYSPIQFYSVDKYGSGSITLSQRDCILVSVIKLAKAILSTFAQGRNNRKHHKSAKLSWNQMAMVVNVLVVFAVFVVDVFVVAGFFLHFFLTAVVFIVGFVAVVARAA